jgi:hypothetical protein
MTEKPKPKFKIDDRVQTNLAYLHGFDDKVCAPPGLKWLKNLVIKEVIFVGKQDTDSQYTEPFLCKCVSKTKEYLINQCFLENGGSNG